MHGFMLPLLRLPLVARTVVVWLACVSMHATGKPRVCPRSSSLYTHAEVVPPLLLHPHYCQLVKTYVYAQGYPHGQVLHELYSRALDEAHPPRLVYCAASSSNTFAQHQLFARARPLQMRRAIYTMYAIKQEARLLSVDG